LGFSTFAKDSLSLKPSQNKWQLELLGNYNYNFRKIGSITDAYITGHKIDRSSINQYLDTGNIACYTKSIGILISRKIWKNLSIQSGLIYGRKGYMYSRQYSSFNAGYSNFGSYIRFIPEQVYTFPLMIKYLFSIYKNKVSIGASIGSNINLYSNQNKYKDANFYQTTSYLSEETSGFFGFTPATKFPGETRLLHEYNTVPFLQYNLGLIIHFKMYKSLFTSFNYNYISQFKYFESKEYYYNSFPFNQFGLGGFSYEIKPYIHSFGIGLGFEF
jgi:hypothetical protein